MCGRYNLTLPVDALARLFAFSELPNLAPRYNIAPTQQIAVARQTASGGRELAFMRWGLVPAWSKAIGTSAALINARAETVADKPSFRAAFRLRRCLVPATGYYEWRRDPSGKQPFHIAAPDGDVIALAGIWESWLDPNNATAQPMLSVAFMTTVPTTALAAVHDRMPVILNPRDWNLWLDPNVGIEPLKSCLAPYRGPLSIQSITGRLNNVRYDASDIIEPLDDRAPRLL